MNVARPSRGRLGAPGTMLLLHRRRLQGLGALGVELDPATKALLLEKGTEAASAAVTSSIERRQSAEGQSRKASRRAVKLARQIARLQTKKARLEKRGWRKRKLRGLTRRIAKKQATLKSYQAEAKSVRSSARASQKRAEAELTYVEGPQATERVVAAAETSIARRSSQTPLLIGGAVGVTAIILAIVLSRRRAA